MGEERRRFEETFLPFLDAAYNLARWIVQHDQDAQDVVQEAYLRAFKGYRGFRGGNGRAWLLTIVRNTAYSWINKHATDEKLVPYEEEKHAEIISFDRSSREIVSEKRKEYVQNALLRLSPEYREVNADMTLAGFKRIFWWEYAHRLLGRAIGVVFLVPGLWFALRRRLPHEVVRTGHQFIGVDHPWPGGARVRFADGSDLVGRAVVGATRPHGTAPASPDAWSYARSSHSRPALR